MERSMSCSEKSSSTPAAAASATGMRCYSASYVTPKNASAKGIALPSSSSSSPASSAASGGSKARMWSGGGSGFAVPSEMRRKGRVAGYRVYAVEGRVKGSLKSGVRWIKSKCNHGWCLVVKVIDSAHHLAF